VAEHEMQGLAHVRGLLGAEGVLDLLEFAPDMPPHDSVWLRCPNFIVRRTNARERRKGSAHA